MTSEKVKTLTPAQEAKIPEYVEYWTKLGQGKIKKRVNKEKIKTWVDELYTYQKFKNPEKVLWFNDLDSALVYLQGRMSGKSRSEIFSEAIFGIGEADWLAWYTFWKKEVGVKDLEFATPYAEILQRCAFVWFYDEECILVKTPFKIHLNTDGELDREDGPAYEEEKGKGLYFIGGVPVTEQIVMRPETLTVSEIKNTENAEVRRIMRERFGDGEYLSQTDAKILHVDSVPVDALVPGGESIQRALMIDNENMKWLVGSDGSTSRVYYMRVPEEVTTCQEAYNSLSGRSDVRTICEA